MKDDRLYVIHISECIGRIEAFTAEGKAAFVKDLKTQDAVIRNLQILAESSQQCSPALQTRHPEIDWRGLAGFRNILVHDYLGVNVERVWELVERELPNLKRHIAVIKQELGV